jgi:hypothetical protein
LEKLAKDRWFSKIDLQWGFNNVRICEGDKHKATFITEQGLFEPLVMQFGLCNAPAMFQCMMDHVLAKEKVTRR